MSDSSKKAQSDQEQPSSPERRFPRNFLRPSDPRPKQVRADVLPSLLRSDGNPVPNPRNHSSSHGTDLVFFSVPSSDRL
jgi:hypothetical protein